MEYKVKSIILGRKNREHKTDDDYPLFISLFDINNPHTSGKVPKDMLDFPHIHKVIIKGLDINYLLGGNDIIINNLETITIQAYEGHVHITGIQNSPN